jgi:hypothetical protein
MQCWAGLFATYRGFRIQGSFLALGSAAAVTAAATAGNQQCRLFWTLSGALLFAVVPYTMLVHMPTTKHILRQVGQGSKLSQVQDHQLGSKC